MRKTLIVNLFGGPCSGKSTTRAGIFNILKLNNIECEESLEWFKSKVYEENPYIPKDQLYSFSKQRKSLLQLVSKVNVVITDSPLLLSIIYSKEPNPYFQDLVLWEFSRFNNFNFFLNRNFEYKTSGRINTEEEATIIDLKIKKLMIENEIKYEEVDGDENTSKILAHKILKKLQH